MLPFRADHGGKNETHSLHILKRKPVKSMTKGRQGRRKGEGRGERKKQREERGVYRAAEYPRRPGR